MDLKTSYKTGFEEQDKQHEKLIEILTSLTNAFEINSSKVDLTKIMEELADYTDYHFKFEEKIMSEMDYPEAGIHKEQHKYFIEKISEFNKKANSGNTYIKVPIILHLKEWVLEHICNSDKKFAEFYKKLS